MSCGEPRLSLSERGGRRASEREHIQSDRPAEAGTQFFGWIFRKGWIPASLGMSGICSSRLTNSVLGLNSEASDPTKGAVMRRRESGSGCGARGRGSQPRTREAPGPRPGGMMTALQGACWTGTGRARLTAARPRRRKRGPGACVAGASRRRETAMERRSARVSRQTRPRRKAWNEDVAPPGAPSPSPCAEGETKVPQSGAGLRRPRAANNRGDDVCPVVIVRESGRSSIQ